MLIKKPVTRRQILARAGGVAAIQALSPLVPLLEAAEADGVQRRFVYWHDFAMPKSDLVDRNYQADVGDIRFRNDYAPLNEMASKIMFWRNMARPQGGAINGGPHPAGLHAITGWRTLGRTGDKKTKINPDAHSLDQFLAEKLEGQTPYSDIRAGFRNSGKNGEIDGGTSLKRGKVQARIQNPVRLYDDIFKGVVGMGSGGGAANNAASERLARDQSVLDYMLDNIKKIQQRVSHFDRQRIESHTDSVRQTELKISAQLNFTPSGECSAQQPSANTNLNNESIITPLNSELMTQALNCNLTRIIGVCYGPATNIMGYEFLPANNGGFKWHAGTHGNAPATYVSEVLTFRAQQVTKYLKMLDAIEEPNGNTLLDNSIFTWFTDVGRNHNTTEDIHCIMAGGKGRFKGQGKMTNVGNNDKYNQLLASIAHYMGVEVNGYGDPKYGGTGTLSSALFV